MAFIVASLKSHSILTKEKILTNIQPKLFKTLSRKSDILV